MGKIFVSSQMSQTWRLEKADVPQLPTLFSLNGYLSQQSKVLLAAHRVNKWSQLTNLDP